MGIRTLHRKLKVYRIT
ncbi:hypothetical protein [Brevibacillus brevis]